MNERRLLLFLALALAAACALVHSHPAGDPDTFWHLTLGRAVLQHGARTFPEPVALAAFSDPCTAPEWLWEVAAYGLYRAGGFGALCAGLMAIAAGAALAVIFLLRRALPGAPFAATATVAAVVLCVSQCAVILRPHSSYHLLLPAFLGALYAMQAAPAPRRARWLALLVALQLLWVQLHGSFILGPPLLCLFVLDTLRREGAGADRRPLLLAVLASCLTLVTGAYGAGFLSFLIDHSGGDAVRHIQDMAAPRWSNFEPRNPFQGGLWVLALLSLSALLRGRPPARDIALALLGVVLHATAVRFFDAAALLAAPLALRGAAALVPASLPPRVAAPLGLGAAALFMGWLLTGTAGWWGPMLRPGLRETYLPLGAAAFIRGLPPGQRVLSSYEAAAPLGFSLQGHARTFVDGRTPLYFDSADYVVSRLILNYEEALERGLRRHDITVAVAPRGEKICALLQARWDPVFTEGGFTTFMPRGSAPRLQHLTPCGDSHIGPEVCKDGGAGALREIAALSARHPAAFYQVLEALLQAQCGQPPEVFLSRMPARPGDYEPVWRRLKARAHLQRGQAAAAAALMAPELKEGDLEAVRLLLPALVKGTSPKEARRLLERSARLLDDQMPPQLVLVLARLCMAEGDAECVRFYGMRAATHGVPGAQEVLRWLAERHPSQRVRADAAAWLGLR
jgi:hypothetical protein